MGVGALCGGDGTFADDVAARIKSGGRGFAGRRFAYSGGLSANLSAKPDCQANGRPYDRDDDCDAKP